jgi:general secretion pathway protein G
MTSMLRDTASPESGWTFVEAIIVIAIIVILSGTVAFSSAGYVDRARVAAAESQVAALSMALAAYNMDTGTYPSAAQGLDALWQKPSMVPVPAGWSGPYVERPVPRDPWGTPYRYTRPGPGGLPFEVLSLGADRMPGGVGHNTDVGSATRREHPR